MLDCDGLRDHATHRHSHDMRLLNTESVKQTDRVICHIGDQVAGLWWALDQRCKHRSRLRGRLPVELGRETLITIVERDHLETCRNEPVDESVGPVSELATEAHHQQQRFAFASYLVFNRNAVCFHRCHVTERTPAGPPASQRARKKPAFK